MKICKLQTQINHFKNALFQKMKLILTFSFIVLTTTMAFSSIIPPLKKGRWVGKLELNNETNLNFEINVGNGFYPFSFTLKNGEELVPMNEPVRIGDSISIAFSNFNSEFKFKAHNKKKISGRWINHLKTDYSIPFQAELSKETIFPVNKNIEINQFDGKWKSQFSPHNNPYDAIGIFKQNGHSLSGTFLTETGDFRFLSGNVSGNEMQLSGFDGSHAFYFKGRLANNQITGSYFSGKHYQTQWTATRNDTFELRPADSLITVIGDPSDFSIHYKDLEGKEFQFPNSDYSGKVVILQFLGTWCANCMDETVYFKELLKKYQDRGLEIVTIGYEIGESFEDYAHQLKMYRKRFNLEHKIIVGGNARKSSAKADLPFLSDFTSFPTSIFVDKSGKITYVHSGFSGPSTGNYFTEYKRKIEALLEEMLND